MPATRAFRLLVSETLVNPRASSVLPKKREQIRPLMRGAPSRSSHYIVDDTNATSATVVCEGWIRAMHEERFDSGDGLSIFFRSWRPATKPSGAVVIVHGFNAHSGYYMWVAEQLVIAGLAVY